MKKLLNEINRVLDEKEIDYFQKGMLISLKEELMVKIKSEENKEENYNKAIEMSNSIKNVHLGCGKHLIVDYINIDINEECDIFWDVRKNLPFKDNSIKRIFSEHFFEHLDYPISANKLLSESYRVLENDGEFIIGVPDCDIPIKDCFINSGYNMNISKEKWYFNRKDVLDSMNTNLDYLNYVMRDQLYHQKYHPHYWGYNKNNLTILLQENGFKLIDIWYPDNNLINPKRKWGTLYLIAKK